MKILLRTWVIFSFVLGISFLNPGFGQITITSADFSTTVGEQTGYFEAEYVYVPSYTSAAGPNQFWDFSYADTLNGWYWVVTNLDPALSPYPGVNFLQKWMFEMIPGIFMVKKLHFILSSASLVTPAYEFYTEPNMMDSLSFVINPPFNNFIFPVTYQSSWSNTYTTLEYRNGVLEDSTLYQSDFVVDGWGQVTTPYNTFDCLRTFSVVYEWNDSLGVWGDPIDSTYLWMANNIGMVFQVSNYSYDPTSGGYTGFVTYVDPTAVGIEPKPGIRIPDQVELFPNYPNPFNPVTHIGFRISDFGLVELRVYDLAGREVATLLNKGLPAGYHTVLWDGKNNLGQEVSSGIYLYRLKTAHGVKVRKMILIR